MLGSFACRSWSSSDSGAAAPVARAPETRIPSAGSSASWNRLAADQARLAVRLAAAQHQVEGGTESFLVTREFREIATREQCRELLDCLFAVSAADDSISGVEEGQIRQIASELNLEPADLAEVRARWAEKRAILKGLRDAG
jgi:Tellurite resistance protein TerB